MSSSASSSTSLSSPSRYQATRSPRGAASAGSVSAICEALWSCRQPEEALEWIQRLTQVLGSQQSAQRDGNAAYHHQDFDPSDTFLAIQAAELRFRTALNVDFEGEGNQQETEVEPTTALRRQQYTDIRYEALSAVAALCQVCVGPAWQQQRANAQTRQEMARQHRRRPSATASQMRPRASWEQQHRPTALYGQHIPEVLPAAILRFAASMPSEQGDAAASTLILQAQMQIVSSLCFSSTAADTETISVTEWSIPDVQEPLCAMILTWLEATISDSYTYTLRHDLLQHVHELYENGWAPSSQQLHNVVDSSIAVALERAKQGLQRMQMIVASDAVNAVDSCNDDDAAVAVVVACGAEALAILAAMGSRGMIPESSLALVVKTVCGFHAEAQHLALNLTASSDNHAELVDNMETYIAETDDILWYLLAQDSFADVCVNELMGIVARDDLSSPTCCILPVNAWNDTQALACRRATSAIKTLSCAFWTTSEGGESLILLRIYWLPLLEVILRMIRSNADLVQTLDDESTVHELSSLVAELFMALGRVMENERRDHAIGCKLNDREWEVTIKDLENVLLKWLASERKSALPAHQAAKLFVMQLCRSLEYWTIFQNTPFVEYEVQETLYLTLLQKMVPMMTSPEAETIGLAVVECWAKFGFFPFRLDHWAATASKLLDEAFRTRDGGMFTHKPSVRLKALTLLTADGSLLPEQSRATEREQPPSLLVLTQHTREHYLHFVEYLMPVLTKICLSPEIVDGQAGAPNLFSSRLTGDSDYSQYAQELVVQFESASPVTRYSSLAIYATQLTGRLFRASSGHSDHRQFFVKLLRQVTLSDSEYEVAFRIRLAAVSELERCLAAGFTTLPHAHACIPSVINALLITFNQYRVICISDSCPAFILAANALNPLTRLRVAIDNHIVFRQSHASIDTSPEILCRLFQAAAFTHQFAAVETQGSSNFEVANGTTTPSSSVTTVISLDDIVESALLFLQQPQICISPPTSAIYFGIKCLRIQCFGILRHHFLASIPFKISSQIAKSVFAMEPDSQTQDFGESQAKFLALVQYGESMCIAARRETSSSPVDPHHFALILELILLFFEADRPSERAIVSNAVIALRHLVTDTVDRSSVFRGSIERIHASLRMVIQSRSHSVLFKIGNDNVNDILAMMFDLLIDPTSLIPMDVFRLGFELFARQAESTAWTPDSLSTLLGLHCAASCFSVLEAAEKELIHTCLLNLNPKDICVQSLIGLGDIMKRQSMLERESADQTPFGRSRYAALVREEHLVRNFAHESLHIRSHAAWLVDGNYLLTCRLGAANSRYAGYIELLFRSHVDRQRSVIQIPRHFHMDDPDFLASTVGARPSPNKTPDETSEFTAYTIPDKTKQVMSRFEALMATSEVDKETSKSNEHIVARFDAFTHPTGDLKMSSLGVKGEILPTTNDESIERWLEQLLQVKSDVPLVLKAITRFLETCGVHQSLASNFRRLRFDEGFFRAIAVLDFAPIMNTHKIALVYGQSAEFMDFHSDLGARLLSTKTCSPEFHKFASGLGSVVPTNSLKAFSGGLDTSSHETDGKFALAWTNLEEAKSLVASTSIVYHVVSFMPSHGSRNVVNRKRHVGNDYVVICFLDRGSDAIVEYDLLGGELIGGAFGLVVIFVTALKSGVYIVSVRVRSNLTDTCGNQCLSSFVNDYSVLDKDAPALVRSIALRADIACRAVTGAPDALPNFVYRRQVLNDMKRFAV